MLDLRMGPGELFGALYAALTVHGFVQMEAEYRRRLRGASGLQANQVRAQWQRHVAAFSAAFASAGRRGVGEAQLRKYASELTRDSKNYAAVVKIANTAVDVVPGATVLPTGQPTAAFVTQTGVVRDLIPVVTPIPGICSAPISEGSFTKQFNHSIALSVTIKYPCGISWGGIRWCKKKVTLAGVNFTLSMNVGYKVTCCGATVWGQVSGQACATIVGVKVCASCTATVTGVAGVSRTPVANGCQYGLGVNATLKCTLAGATILSVAYPFGWTITGPCPPAGFCP